MNRPRTRIACFVFFASFAIGTARDCRAADQTKPDDALLKHVEEAIRISKRRFLTARQHTPWQIMHGILAYRGDYQIKDAGGKKLINAVKWMSSGPKQGGKDWFLKTEHGARPHPYTTDYVFEGHPNQFLAIMAMAGFPTDHKLKAGKATITVQDLVNHAKQEITTRDEETWSLWALSRYLGPTATWTNKYGQAWSIEYLVSEQTKAATARGACGGTHGMFALAYARNTYMKTRRPLRGVWLQADVHIKRHIAIAKNLQNDDGSFSSKYFAGRGYTNDFEKRLSASGHTLEFLMLALTDAQLKEEWVRKGIASVARDLIDNKYKAAEPGALYHALDGLIIYRERVRGTAPRLVKHRLPVEAKRPTGDLKGWRKTASRHRK